MDSIYSQAGDSMYVALSKAAARFALSIVRSGRYLSDAYAEALLSLLSAESLWTLCLILAAWALATIVGGPLALAVDGLLIAYGLYSLYEQLAATWTGLRAWAQAAYRATSEEQLDEAAKAFATTVAAGSLDLLTVLLTHKLFRKAKTTLGSRVPRPPWLDEELAAAKQDRARQKATRPNEKPGLATESPEPTRPQEGSGKLRTLTEPALNLGRAAGAAPLSPRPSALPAVLLGGALFLGAATAVAVAAWGGTHGRKK